MGIEDIQISEELETNAPSIKYRGEEGPRSPQQEQQMMMAQLEEAYGQYVDEMIQMGQEDSIMSLRQFIEQAMAEGQMSGGQPLPQDPTKPVNPFAPKPTGPTLPNRQMAAYGGIMGVDGRRQYGLGSSLKKRFRKLIPNEVAKVAEVAAPFVAPFNPLAAAAMSGIGSFDRTGKIGSSLKSGLMNYGMGQLSRGIGGGMGNLQKGINPLNTANLGGKAMGEGMFSKYLSNPIQDSGGLGKYFKENFTDKLSTSGGSMVEGVDEVELQKIVDAAADKKLSPAELISKKANEAFIKNTQAKNLGLLDRAKDFVMDNKLLTLLLAKEGMDLLGGPEQAVDEIMDRGEGMDVAAIRAEVQEAFADTTGEKLSALRVKYPFLGRADTKDIENMAMGGRIGFAEGGGIMDLGGMEKDYRAEGGFVPIGKAEKADDVPARLSVNEFVFTADAVRNAGGGDIDKGAEVMENMMKHLEQGGQVSDESQGMAGAQQMFETSERLSEVI
jgi:hypothetical protein